MQPCTLPIPGLLIIALTSLVFLLTLAVHLVRLPTTAHAATQTTFTAPIGSVQPLTNISQLASGYDHTCVLATSGAVKCWGANWTGQLGDGTTLYRPLAISVGGLTSTITALATGADHTCVVTSSGSVQCWGGNVGGNWVMARMWRA